MRYCANNETAQTRYPITGGNTDPNRAGGVWQGDEHGQAAHAIAYHFFKDHDTTGPILERIRTTYNGPLGPAEDYMVWNLTKDKITEHIAIVDHHTWTPPMASPAVAPNPNDRVPYSPEIEAGRFNVDDVIKPIYEEAGKALGRKFEYPEN
jgi:ribonuclease Z